MGAGGQKQVLAAGSGCWWTEAGVGSRKRVLVDRSGCWRT